MSSFGADDDRKEPSPVFRRIENFRKRHSSPSDAASTAPIKRKLYTVTEVRSDCDVEMAEPESVAPPTEAVESNNVPTEPGNVGFRTAAGNAVSISEEALEWAEKVFRQEETLEAIRERSAVGEDDEDDDSDDTEASSGDSTKAIAGSVSDDEDFDYIACAIPWTSFSVDLDDFSGTGFNDRPVEGSCTSSSNLPPVSTPLHQHFQAKFYSNRKDTEAKSSSEGEEGQRESSMPPLYNSTAEASDSSFNSDADSAAEYALHLAMGTPERTPTQLADGSVAVFTSPYLHAKAAKENNASKAVEKGLPSADSLLKNATLTEESGCDVAGSKGSCHAFTGFKTAGGRSVIVKPESIERAKAMLTYSYEEETVNSRNSLRSSFSGPPSETEDSTVSCLRVVSESPMGFHTALGEVTSVTAESLEKAGAVWMSAYEGGRSRGGAMIYEKPETESKSLMPPAERDAAPSIQENGTNDSSDFGTASGKAAELQNKLCPENELVVAGEMCAAVDLSIIEGYPVTFRTERKDAIAIRPESVQKAGAFVLNVFEEGSRSSDDSLAYKQPTKTDEDATSPMECDDVVPSEEFYHGVNGISFKTASGKTVDVKKESLRKAMALMKDVAAPEDNSSVQRQLGARSSLRFQTAREGSIGFRHKFIDRANRLLMESKEGEYGDDARSNRGSGDSCPYSPLHAESADQFSAMECDTFPTKLENSSGTTGISGFTTASGNTLAIDKESLRKAVALMKEAGASEGSSPRRQRRTRGLSTSFQTAGGGSVSVRKESLLKAALLLSADEDGGSSARATSETGHHSKMETEINLFYQQPSPMETDLSDIREKAEGPSCHSELPSAFNTASGKMMLTSEASVSKAYQLFEETADMTDGRGISVTPRVSLSAFDLPRSHQGRKAGFIGTRGARSPFLPPRRRSVPMTGAGTPSATYRPQTEDDRQKIAADGKNYIAKDGKLYKLWASRSKVKLSTTFEGHLPDISCKPHQLLDYGLAPAVVEVSSRTAENFYFAPSMLSCENGKTAPATLTVGDDVQVETDANGGVSFEEIFRSFCACPNVDEKLISCEWVKNHYRWIVWKLAAMEKSFPLHCAGKCLTLNNVMLQLKYRYDREIEHSHRSIVKKILNRDYPSAAPMVLFVSEVLTSDFADALATVVLSDGWYQVRAQCDKALSTFVKSFKITVGMKLFIVGATMYGADEGCEPLEAPESVRLSLSVNGVRRARWFTKLGYKSVKDPVFSLRSLFVDGGTVPAVDVILCRKYPLMFLEKRCEGKSVMRNERAYETYLTMCIDKQSTLVEKMMAEKFGDRENGKSICSAGSQFAGSADICDDSELERLKNTIAGCSDPSLLTEVFSASQVKRVERRCQTVNKKMEVLKNEIERTVATFLKDNPLPKFTPLLTFAVHGAAEVDQKRGSVARLVIWRPDMEDLYCKLQEGKTFRIHRLQLTTMKNTLELSTTQSSFVEELPNAANLPPEVYTPRSVTPFEELKSGTYEAFLKQIDIVGVVVDIALGTRGSTVYLGDHLMNFVAVQMEKTLESYGWEGVINIGKVIACSNLVYNESCKARVPHVGVFGLSQITENPKEFHLSCALDLLVAEIKTFPNYLIEAKKSLQSTLKGYGGFSNACLSPYAEEFRKPVVDLTHMPYSPVTLVTKPAARAAYKSPFRYKTK